MNYHKKRTIIAIGLACCSIFSACSKETTPASQQATPSQGATSGTETENQVSLEQNIQNVENPHLAYWESTEAYTRELVDMTIASMQAAMVASTEADLEVYFQLKEEYVEKILEFEQYALVIPEDLTEKHLETLAMNRELAELQDWLIELERQSLTAESMADPEVMNQLMVDLEFYETAVQDLKERAIILENEVKEILGQSMDMEIIEAFDAEIAEIFQAYAMN